jgi:NAD(P)-dependent dehydrogenase (short-subunit alcohol dehydrogenase family)
MRECIVVTGASRGIGAAIALALAQQGHHVACLSRSGAAPQHADVAQDVSARWITGQADVSRAGAMQQALAKLAADGWQVAGLVNNAGLHLHAASSEMPLDQWREVMDTNATSVVLACQAAYPHLVKAGGGLIVNIGSFFDKLGVKQNLAYCASKAAVGAITRCLAVEWAGKGIRVVDVAPGYVQTDLNAESMAAGPLRAYLDKRIPVGRPGTAAEVASLVASLFAHGAGFLTGETIYVDGGQGIAH